MHVFGVATETADSDRVVIEKEELHFAIEELIHIVPQVPTP